VPQAVNEENGNIDSRNIPVLGDHGELGGIVSMGNVLKYAKALDVDENVRKAWKEIEEHWDSVEHYTPG
jgi:translation initiation factor IF-3